MRSSARVDLLIRPYRHSDEEGVLDLLRLALAGGPTGQRTAAFFRWKHAQNPFGPSVALVAEVDGALAGFRTFMRWRFRTQGRSLRALRPVDTATHPAYQGRGIFTRLTLEAVREAREEAELIFNTPNQQSLPGYRKMGWSEVGRMPIAFRVVRPLRFARGLRHATRGAPGGPPPPSPLPRVADVLADERAVATLLAEADTQDARLATDRSVAYLRWRFGAAPDLDYRALTTHAGGRLAGLAIVRPRRRGPLHELDLVEVLVRNGDRAAARRLLHGAARAGPDHVATHLAAGTTAAAAAPWLGYLAPPRMGVTLVANPLADVRPDPLLSESWRLSLADLEVF